MPPANFYKNRILKDSWYQVEVGDFPRLKRACVCVRCLLAQALFGRFVV